MPKPNRNGCKIGKQTNLLVQATRSAVQKSQVTVDTKTTNKQSMYHTSEQTLSKQQSMYHTSE